LRYPADPPPVEEVVAVMRVAGESAYGLRTRARIVVLWRAGLRISEALALYHAKQCSDAQGDAEAQPRVDLFPRPPIHADLAALAAFASEDEDRAAVSVEVTFGYTVRRRVAHGRPRVFAKPFASSRSEPACVVASCRISFGTRTLLRWLEKACRST
jgi:hypothetical protein